jgi:hypothetical protein
MKIIISEKMSIENMIYEAADSILNLVPLLPLIFIMSSGLKADFIKW